MSKARKKTHQRIFLDVLFCDDVRQEIGDKTTLVGIYKQELIVDSFPATLPRLAIVVRIGIDDRNYLDGGNINVHIGKRSIGPFEVDTGERVHLEVEKMLIEAVIIMDQIVFDEACEITVTYSTKSEILTGFSLIVRNADKS
ncbi:DUF6941 family protein [Thalassobaculum fulvum]|nr:hypothetical protein [Thalassobaculum fulvum]